MCMGKPPIPEDATAYPVADLLANNLREVFKGEPWDVVEPCARRAWECVHEPADGEWNDIRAYLQARFEARFEARRRTGCCFGGESRTGCTVRPGLVRGRAPRPPPASDAGGCSDG